MSVYSCHFELYIFKGVNCEVNVDDCTHVVCQNGGTCLDGINSYHCACASSWTGVYCQCRLEWYDEGSSRYLFVTNFNSVLDAETHCNMYDSHLVSIKNPAVLAELKSAYIRAALGGGEGDINGYLTSARDDHVDLDGVFLWDDGSPVQYTRWVNGEPNNVDYDEHCTVAIASMNFNLMDVSCTQCFMTICQMDVVLEDNCPAMPGQHGGSCIDGTNMFTCVCASGWRGDYCQCPGGWIDEGNSCYMLVHKDLNYENAKSNCAGYNVGAHLVSIKNLPIQAEIKRAFIRAGSKSGQYLTSATDSATEGSYVWEDTYPALFLMWKDGEPNNVDEEDCLVTLAHDDFSFIGVDCEMDYGSICQIDVLNY